MTTILFHRGKLCVGIRMEDSLEVWTRPATTDGGAIIQDDDETITPELFKFKTIEGENREPMLTEVIWVPHFNPVYFDAQDKKSRERKQMQFIGDAWKYLNETDPDVVRRMDETMNRPGYRKWQTWFDKAKVFKRKQMRERQRRRNRRTQEAQEVAQATGMTPDEIEVNSDSSGEDSGFEDEPSANRARMKRPRGVSADMPPPPLPRDNRRRRGGEDDSSGPAKKRPKPKPKSKKGKNPTNGDDEDDEQQQMSGGLLSRNAYFKNDGRETIMGGLEELSSVSSEHSNNRFDRRRYQANVESVSDEEFDGQLSDFDFSTPEPPPARVNSPTGSNTSPLFVSEPRTPSNSSYRGGLLHRRMGATASPISHFRNGRTGFGATLDPKRRSSMDNPNVRNGSARPIQPGNSHIRPVGISMGEADLFNVGMTEEEAIASAKRASQDPSGHEEAVNRARAASLDPWGNASRAAREGTGRSSQGRQTGHGVEQQPVTQVPPVGDEDTEAAQPEVQKHPAEPNEPNAAAADESDDEDLTGDD